MKEQKGLKFALLFFIILTLGLGGYVIYDKVLEPIKNSTEQKLNDKEEPEPEQPEEPKKREYTQYLVLNPSEGPSYLAGVSEGKYYELLQFSNEEWSMSVQPIGLHDNKLYYLHDYGIQYIDLNEDELKEVMWIKYPEEEDGELNDVSGTPVILGDNLIFNLSSSDGNSPLDGILSLDLDAKDINESKQLVKDATFDTWVIDDQKENIYYIEFGYGSGDSLSVYNFKTGSTKKLVESVGNNIDYKNGYLLYSIKNYAYDTNCSSLGQLYLYDTKTKTSKLINKNACNLYIAKFLDNNVYYLDTEGNAHFYSISNETDTAFAKVYAIKYDYYEDKIYVKNGSSTLENEYIINHEYQEENIEVIMKDNTKEKFGKNDVTVVN